MVDESGESLHERLSDREFQVLCLIAAGKPPREIATELNLSVRTVGTHRARLLAKMGLKNNAQLVQYAIEHHLLPDVGSVNCVQIRTQNASCRSSTFRMCTPARYEDD